MDTLELPVIVIGGRGHAKVLVSTLLLCRRSILGFVDLNPTAPPLLGVRCLGSDAAVLLHAPGDVRLVNGVGCTGSTASRRAIYDRFTHEGYYFATVIHPSAIVAPEVHIEDGVQIMAGAILQPGSSVGSNAIVNTGAIIDHDCVVGAHAHIAPGAVLSGAVHVDSGAHVGTGACIIQGVSIGAASVVGAGAVVIKDVSPGVTAVGVPAKTIDRKKLAQNPR
ncbi:MAG: acetyltransferase [Terriglobales bacterium]|jgi:sugar O-acyltransferase (sialic acid O-acetyltransferase NeuD family)